MNYKNTFTRTVAFAALACVAVASPDARAQKDGDPNLGHFYMGRQQITITDDAPMVNDKRSNGAAPGAMQGAMPARRAPLPAAGWQSFAPAATNPNLSTSLPKVVNGVPPKEVAKPLAKMNGTKGKAGALGAAKPKPAGPFVDPKAVQAYKPYASSAGPLLPAGAGGDVNQQSKSNVQGNVLHWARGRQTQ
jgi:hypothetical protein